MKMTKNEINIKQKSNSRQNREKKVLYSKYHIHTNTHITFGHFYEFISSLWPIIFFFLSVSVIHFVLFVSHFTVAETQIKSTHRHCVSTNHQRKTLHLRCEWALLLWSYILLFIISFLVLNSKHFTRIAMYTFIVMPLKLYEISELKRFRSALNITCSCSNSWEQREHVTKMSFMWNATDR